MKAKQFFTLSFLVLLALAVSACSGVASAQAPTATPLPAGNDGGNGSVRTISVSGEGKVYLTPDIAYVTIGIQTRGANASDAVAENNDQSEALTKALTAFGIEAKDIRTSNFSIYPQQQYDPQGQPTGEITYVVDNSVYVTVRDINKVGDLLDAAVKAGANSIYGVQFDVADKSKAMTEARKAAIADAKALAQELTSTADVSLGQLVSINVNSNGYPGPIYDGKGGGAMVEAAASVPVSPGQMLLTVNVNLVFEIR